MVIPGHDRPRTRVPATRWFDALSSASIVFPVAALVLAILTFFTMPPTPAIVGLLAVALLPWAFVAGGVHVPHLLLMGLTLGATALLVLRYDDQGALFLPIVAISWVASHGTKWTTALGVVGGTAISVSCDMVTKSGDQAGWIIWGTGMVFGWFTGAMLHRQRMLTAELSEARQELALAAIANERKQIAREVHDIVGHSLTVVLLNVVGARRHLSSNPQAAAEALERAEAVSRDSLDTVRSVVGLLSSGTDSQTDAPLPGGADVVPLIERARSSGLPVRLHVDGDPASLEPALGLTVVRLLQEALSNASRHAPGATVDVQISIEPQTVTATIANDLHVTPAGIGSGAPARAGLGVSSMTERVAAVHGTIDVGPRDHRWVVRGVLPRSVHRAVELRPA